MHRRKETSEPSMRKTRSRPRRGGKEDADEDGEGGVDVGGDVAEPGVAAEVPLGLVDAVAGDGVAAVVELGGHVGREDAARHPLDAAHLACVVVRIVLKHKDGEWSISKFNNVLVIG